MRNFNERLINKLINMSQFMFALVTRKMLYLNVFLDEGLLS